MKRIMVIALSLWMTVTQAIAQNNSKDSATLNDRVDKVHFKISYKTYHKPRSLGISFLQRNLRKGYHVVIPNDANKQGLTLERLQRRRTYISPMLLSSSSAVYGNRRQLDFCSLPSAAGNGLYQCSAVKVSGKVFRPEIESGNKLADITDDDGGMDISLTQKASFTMDFGYGSGMDSIKDTGMDMDGDTDDGLVNMGLQIGIK